jgi:cytochrome P450
VPRRGGSGPAWLSDAARCEETRKRWRSGAHWTILSDMTRSPNDFTASPRPFREVPRPGALGLLRNLLNAAGERVDMLGRLTKMHDECGPVAAMSAGPFKMVHLFGPDANRFVLMDKDEIFSARKPWTQIMGRIFPNGLLLRDGDDHKHHRRIMHHAFRRPVLRRTLESMNPMIEAGIAGWSDRSDFLAFPAIKELTLDIAARIFLGEDLGPQTRRLNGAFEDMVAASMSRIRLPIPGLEFNRGLEGREFMTRFLSDRIEKKRASGGGDLFSLLCRAQSEDGRCLSDQEISDHLIFLMMAAHDTTTSTLTSITYELARHPEWQERVRAESLALGKRHLEFDDVDGLTTLTWVMKETLRRYPPLPVIPRVALRDFEFGGYAIPAGAMVVVSPIHTHHLPEWWSAPFRWDPERFSPERGEDARHTFHWVPFGGGPHHCLGFKFAESQVKAVLHQLVQRIRWSVPDGYEMPVQQAPISKPLDGLPIELRAVA